MIQQPRGMSWRATACPRVSLIEPVAGWGLMGLPRERGVSQGLLALLAMTTEVTNIWMSFTYSQLRPSHPPKLSLGSEVLPHTQIHS